MNGEITHLDLCSGIGGFALAIADSGRRTDRNVCTIAFCEPDKFCQQVLGKHWPEVPIYDDVKSFPKDFGKVDVLTGGYPCQPFSQAGKRKGEADDRNIWPWVLEIVKQTRPSVCVFENVVGHISLGIDTVLLDLATEGYHAWPIILGAVSKNAPHRRQRVFIVCTELADTNGIRCGGGDSSERGLRERQLQSEEQGRREVGRETERCGQPRRKDVGRRESQRPTFSRLGRNTPRLSSWVDGNWERGVPRVTQGQKDRTSRLKALGNAICPQVASEIFTAIFESELL
jgi:DNA (cytosine-5)-methyltransferase 1